VNRCLLQTIDMSKGHITSTVKARIAASEKEFIMVKKGLYLIAIGFIAISIYFINIALKDDTEEIQKAVLALGNPELEVAHIEMIEEKKAVAFYEWGIAENASFGNVLLEKSLLGWEIVSGGSLYLLEDSKLNLGHLDLRHHLSKYKDLIRGKITDPHIESVKVTTTEGKEYPARVINYNNKRFWFSIGEDLSGALVTGFSSDGKIIEKDQISY
jgi:hypothetical protein